ncbi:MAG: hypothetical protein QY332_10075 [Anaerolineales bacterium]|nr:MAG: hypothetical protein QY332_10075 [Anaerolineales bacterium]
MTEEKQTREQIARLLPPPSNGQFVTVSLELLPAYLGLHGLQAHYSSSLVIEQETHFVLHCKRNGVCNDNA